MDHSHELPAPDDGTNITIFVHSNVVQYVHCGGGGGPAAMSGGAAASAPIWASEPVARRVGGSGGVVPVTIFPPGFEFSNYVLFDPSTSEWISGQGITRAWPSAGSGSLFGAGSSQFDPQGDNPPPPGPGPLPPESGFYKVVRNGVWLFGLTNGTLLSGKVTLPIEAGSLDGSPLHSVTLNANGSPIEGATTLSEPLPGLLGFDVDTRRLNNGDYYLQAVGTWFLPLTNEFITTDFQLYSPSVLVTVSNAVSYPDWVQEYRDGLMFIKATSATTNINWRVDVYGQDWSLVRSFTNHSDDGLISISWDLKDSGGTAHSDNFFTAVTTISPPAAPSLTDTNPLLIKVVDNYPDQGLWMVARASYIPTSIQNYGLYTNTINGFAQMGEAGGGVLPGQPYRNSGQAMVLSRATTITNWAAMYRTFLNHHEVRNFYFDGHGGGDWIGYGYDTNGEPTRTFSASLVAGALGNDTPNTNATRFRWVWIDACNAATAGTWPQAFGLGSRENVPLTNYVSRPGAFCGFDAPVYAYGGFHGFGSVDITSINYRGYFLDYWWLFEDPLKDSFDQARDDSGDFSTAQHLKVFGYWGLGWVQYNTKAEWPP